MAWLRRGQILGNRYRVNETLGRGGMGTVVAATDLRASCTVALKVAHRGDLTRFVREADAAARLTSPHVARILETGTFRDGDSTIPFIALEYLEGADLATWLAAHGPLPVATAAAIVVQASHAIAEAHLLGIVHRDLKPGNLFLTTSAGVKVLDFGISRSRDDDRITTTGALVGSPAYMPPERMRPSTVTDARSDIWSLGVVLYEAVSGRLPFTSDVFPDLCLKILLDDVPALDAPDGFVAIVRRCLEKEPEARFQTAGELSAALAAFAEPTPQIAANELELLSLAQREAALASALRKPQRRVVGWGLGAAVAAAMWCAPDMPSRTTPPPADPPRAAVTRVPSEPPAALVPARENPPPPVQLAEPPPKAVAHRVAARVSSVAERAAPQLPAAPLPAVAPPLAKDPLASAF